MALAVANYHDANGRYPPAHVVGPDGRPWHSWRVLILPYIDQAELHEAYNFSEPWDGSNNRILADRMPKVYAFPGEKRPGNTVTNYLAVVGRDTIWSDTTPVSLADVTDGLDVTVLLVENRGARIDWMEPRGLSMADASVQINSPNGISSKYNDPAVVMLDSSLHCLRPTIKPETLRALLTIKGGERLQSDGSGGWDMLPDGRQRPLR